MTEKLRKAQIARKLPFEAKPRMVNYDFGPFLLLKGLYIIFLVSGEKACISRTLRGEKYYTTLGNKKRMHQIAVYHPRLRLGR